MAQPVSLWPWNSMSQDTRLLHLAHQIVDLPRRGHAHRVGDAHAVDAQLVHRLVDRQDVAPGRCGTSPRC